MNAALQYAREAYADARQDDEAIDGEDFELHVVVQTSGPSRYPISRWSVLLEHEPRWSARMLHADPTKETP